MLFFIFIFTRLLSTIVPNILSKSEALFKYFDFFQAIEFFMCVLAFVLLMYVFTSIKNSELINVSLYKEKLLIFGTLIFVYFFIPIALYFLPKSNFENFMNYITIFVVIETILYTIAYGLIVFSFKKVIYSHYKIINDE